MRYHNANPLLATSNGQLCGPGCLSGAMQVYQFPYPTDLPFAQQTHLGGAGPAVAPPPPVTPSMFDPYQHIGTAPSSGAIGAESAPGGVAPGAGSSAQLWQQQLDQIFGGPVQAPSAPVGAGAGAAAGAGVGASMWQQPMGQCVGCYPSTTPSYPTTPQYPTTPSYPATTTYPAVQPTQPKTAAVTATASVTASKLPSWFLPAGLGLGALVLVFLLRKKS